MHIPEFLSGLNSNQHLLQVITDGQVAQNTQFQFLKEGLDKGEYCVYLTHENPHDIIGQMQKFGIDTDQTTNLHIQMIPDLINHPDGALAGFKELLGKIMPNPRPRFRLVGRAIQDITTEEGWLAEMEIEKFVHSTFDEMDGMILCCYEYDGFGHSILWHIKQLLGCHNGLIFSTFSGPGFACSLTNDNHALGK